MVEPYIAGASLIERLQWGWLDLQSWWCAIRGGHYGNWECETCFDYQNVGMTCPHDELWRECSVCDATEFIRDGLPWTPGTDSKAGK